jgi:hypothetical protein
MIGLISALLENWNSFYSNHAAIRTLIGFMHVGGLLIGGGCAISADRMTLLAARRGTEARQTQLDALRDSHRIVLVSLTVVMLSGVLLFAADTATFLHSTFFWVKMALIAALLVNGAVLTRAERWAEMNTARGWRALTITSTLSLTLWLITTLAGTALPNVG